MTILLISLAILLFTFTHGYIGYVTYNHKFDEGDTVIWKNKETKITKFLGYKVYQIQDGIIVDEKDLKSKIEYEYDKWKEETLVLSDSYATFSNPHYRNIVRMGEEAVPFIIEKLKKGPNHIVRALDEILGEIKVEGYISLEDYCKLWIEKSI